MCAGRDPITRLVRLPPASTAGRPRVPPPPHTWYLQFSRVCASAGAKSYLAALAGTPLRLRTLSPPHRSFSPKSPVSALGPSSHGACLFHADVSGFLAQSGFYSLGNLDAADWETTFALLSINFVFGIGF